MFFSSCFFSFLPSEQFYTVVHLEAVHAAVLTVLLDILESQAHLTVEGDN